MKLDEHEFTAISVPKLPLCRSQYDDAARLFRLQVEQWQDQAPVPENIELGQMMMYLGMAEARSGNVSAAADSYRQAAIQFEADWCEGHPKALAARDAAAAMTERVPSRA